MAVQSLVGTAAGKAGAAGRINKNQGSVALLLADYSVLTSSSFARDTTLLAATSLGQGSLLVLDSSKIYAADNFVHDITPTGKTNAPNFLSAAAGAIFGPW